MNKIIILDFSTVTVYVAIFDLAVYSNDNIQEFFDILNENYNLNLKESNCQWMVTIGNEELTINYL